MKPENNKLMIKIAMIFVLSAIIVCCIRPLAHSDDKWPGVDESVVEKYAKEHGRESCEPLINTDQGDLLLFVFLLAGTIGGFIGGYYWRMLIVPPGDSKKSPSL
ncbi:hypothetical protein [Desulfobacterium sp. N47]|uniref:Uncharacterized protein n=1 Tax=uncultured Desulfobacterium sp. TaxID=201089 RepID=E1YAE0_9BACT|nr:hypothetical protein N47_H23560 [uncultured Desulfobacterium sp.]